MKIKVSIIIPVYNVECYLEECLYSVCNQTLKDIEIICINDGSTDRCPEILQRWENKDTRIKVLHQENKGYGRSVNRGIEKATGEYVGIVEPDDYINVKMMEILYSTAVKENVDFVKADFEMFRGDRENRYTEQAKVVSEDSLYGRILNPNIETGVFWSWIANWAGIYKRSFLVKNQIKHNETPGASFQDQGFWFQVYAFAERAFFLPEVFYKYRQDNPNSSMLSKNKVFCIADEYSFIYQVMSKKKKKFIPLIPIYIKRKFDQYLSNYDRLEEEYRIPFLHRFSKDFWEHKKNGELDLKYFNYKEKKALSMIIDSPELYPIMYEAEVKSFNAMLENKNIWIYGAGKVAEETWEILTESNKKRVKGIFVSELAGNDLLFHGIPVMQFEAEKISNTKKNILVVALSLKNAEMILKRIVHIDNNNYVLVKEFITANSSK